MPAYIKGKKLLTIIFFCCLIPSSTFCQSLKQFILQKKEQFSNRFADTSSKPNYLIYPTLAYTPETRTEFGFVNLFLFYAKNDKRNRLSEINTFTFYTAEKQYGFWMEHAIYGDKEKWFYLGKGKFQYFPMKYFGVGIKRTDKDYLLVNNSNIQLRERVLRRVVGDFYTGVEVDFQKVYNVQFGTTNPSNLDYPRGYNGSTNLGVGLGLVYDTRRNVMNVRSGKFAEIAYLNYSPSIGSTYKFQSTQFDLRYFRQGFHSKQVIGVQAMGFFNKGQVPFNQMALMGGEMMMRGYYQGRYRDNNLMAAQAEYRFLPFPFSKRWGATLFASAGTVAPTASTLISSPYKMAGGLGARYLAFKSKDIFLRLDIAFTSEGRGYYLFFGESF
jgi:hypothetical protein